MYVGRTTSVVNPKGGASAASSQATGVDAHAWSDESKEKEQYGHKKSGKEKKRVSGHASIPCAQQEK